MREEDYAYVSGDLRDETECQYDKSKGVTKVASTGYVAPAIAAIKAAIEIGPVNLAVSAGNRPFQMYKSGIITE